MPVLAQALSPAHDKDGMPGALLCQSAAVNAGFICVTDCHLSAVPSWCARYQKWYMLLLPCTSLNTCCSWLQYDPETFTTWCKILHRVPASVLWLLRFPPYGEPRIRAEAAARGIDPARIVFTDVAAKPVHIRRSGIADVFLDTPLCNAHTTGALPALPVSTKPLSWRPL